MHLLPQYFGSLLVFPPYGIVRSVERSGADQSVKAGVFACGHSCHTGYRTTVSSSVSTTSVQLKFANSQLRASARTSEQGSRELELGHTVGLVHP